MIYTTTDDYEYARVNIAIEVMEENARQMAKWGPQDDNLDFLPVPITGTSGRAWLYGVPTEEIAKATCEMRANVGRLSWCDVLIEELAEAVEAPTTEHLREELIQVSAVALSWVSAIDRRTRAAASYAAQQAYGNNV